MTVSGGAKEKQGDRSLLAKKRCIVLHYRTRLIEPINVSLTVQLQQSHPRELARLGWLPRQARLPLHGGWYRTGTVCHWPWNVKSTMRKTWSSPTQTWIACKSGGLPTASPEAALFCTAQSLFRTISDSLASRTSLSRVCAARLIGI